MRSFIQAVSLAFFALSQTGHALVSDDPQVDDNSSFPFYIEGENQYYGEFHYSGQRSWVEQGVMMQDWTAPDCLILAGSFEALDPKKVAEFLSKLEVRDQLRFGEGGDVLNWTLYQDNYVYFLKGLSLFVNGILIKTQVPSQTFYELMVETFGERRDNLRLILSRGCRLASQ